MLYVNVGVYKAENPELSLRPPKEGFVGWLSGKSIGLRVDWSDSCLRTLIIAY